MATELAGVRRAIGDAHGKGLVLRVIGVGRQRTEAGIAAVAADSPTAIVAVGFCGAADPSLRTGDLHVAEVFYSADRTGSIASHPELTAWAKTWGERSETGVVGGPSVTVAAAADPQRKSDLHAATGAVSVNMEDYWAAIAAAAHGIPFASIRAVLDTADDEIPAYLDNVGDGIIDVLRGVAGHPGSIPSLIKLAGKARVARASLAHCVSGLLDSMPSPLTGVARSAQ